MMDFNALKAPFPVEKISWRVGATTKDKTKAIGLAYIDARDVMERLDEVCGVENWQCTHPHANGKTSCRIGIKIGDEWVWKENGAGDTNVEAEKGAFSDSLKRAAVVWGIGRYLYDMPNIWVPIDQYKKITPEGIKTLENALRKMTGDAKEDPPVVQKAKKIAAEFPLCKTLADLNAVWRRKEVQEIKAENEKTFKWLEGEYNKKVQELGQPESEAA